MKSLKEKNEEFVLNILHDIKSPITGINIALEGLNFKNEIIEEIYKVNKHNLEYIENLIENYSFKTGKYLVQREKFNIIALINEEIFALRFLILDKKIKLNLADKTSSIPVITDKKLLRQIILNLLTNAIKYSPKEEEIKIEIKRGAQNSIILSILNSCEGKKEGSTGLGLEIVKNSLELINGKFCLKKEGKKYKFLIKIPEI